MQQHLHASRCNQTKHDDHGTELGNQTSDHEKTATYRHNISAGNTCHRHEDNAGDSDRNELKAEARADIFDYIECFYNPRRRRKLEINNQKKSNLTHPSVVTG